MRIIIIVMSSSIMESDNNVESNELKSFPLFYTAQAAENVVDAQAP